MTLTLHSGIKRRIVRDRYKTIVEDLASTEKRTDYAAESRRVLRAFSFTSNEKCIAPLRVLPFDRFRPSCVRGGARQRERERGRFTGETYRNFYTGLSGTRFASYRR